MKQTNIKIDSQTTRSYFIESSPLLHPKSSNPKFTSFTSVSVTPIETLIARILLNCHSAKNFHDKPPLLSHVTRPDQQVSEPWQRNAFGGYQSLSQSKTKGWNICSTSLNPLVAAFAAVRIKHHGYVTPPLYFKPETSLVRNRQYGPITIQTVWPEAVKAFHLARYW